MKITQEVILDLLPVYLAGEASPDTRALVEEYMKQDEELARRIRLQFAENLSKAAPSALAPDLELRSLRRARKLIGWQRRLTGMGGFRHAGTELSIHLLGRSYDRVPLSNARFSRSIRRLRLNWIDLPGRFLHHSTPSSGHCVVKLFRTGVVWLSCAAVFIASVSPSVRLICSSACKAETSLNPCRRITCISDPLATTPPILFARNSAIPVLSYGGP